MASKKRRAKGRKRAAQKFKNRYTHQEVALGYAITRKAIDDNLYKALSGSFQQSKEIWAANLLEWAEVFEDTPVHDTAGFTLTELEEAQKLIDDLANN